MSEALIRGARPAPTVLLPSGFPDTASGANRREVVGRFGSLRPVAPDAKLSGTRHEKEGPRNDQPGVPEQGLCRRLEATYIALGRKEALRSGSGSQKM